MTGAEDETTTPTCVDCHAVAPPIDTNYTLIGEHGWRVSRRSTTNGGFTVEWRCAMCWAAFKSGSPASIPEGPQSRRRRGG